MTRKEQIKKKMLEISTSNFTSTVDYGAYRAGFIDGVDWADAHPNWISVEDEMPKNKERVFITDGECTDFGFYDYTDDAWQPFEQWLGNITHWMPLPQPPSSSEIPNNYKKGGEQ